MRSKLLLLVFLFNTMACLEDPKTPLADGASFDYTSFTSEMTPLESTNGFINSVRYLYKACLLDIKNQAQITFHKFSISNPDGQITITSTDSSGCLQWQHDVSFEFSGDPQLVEQKYLVTPQGLHKGQLTLKAGINPRAVAYGLSDTLKFVDLNKQTTKAIPQDLAQDILSPNQQDSLQVEISGASLKFATAPPTNKHTLLTMEIKSNPIIVLNDQTGGRITRPLKDAVLSMKASLWVRDSRGQSLLVATANDNNFFRATVENELLAVPIDFPISQFPRAGELYLGLNVHLASSQQTKTPLLTFRLGDVRQFSSSISAERRFDVKLAQIQTNSLHDKGFWRPTNTYFFDPMSLKYGGVVLEDESSSQRTVKILVTACIKDPLFIRTPVLFEDFEITSHLIDTKKDPKQLKNRFESDTPKSNDVSVMKKIVEKTDHTGCLRWSDSLTHKYYESERFFIKQYTVKNLSTGSSHTLEAIVNPWNTGWLFAQDMVERSPSDISNQPENGPRARIFLSGYQMNARGTDYKIDDRLQLYVQRKYNLVLYPKVLRHDSQAYGSMGNEPLRDGLYLLTVALVRNFNQENFDPRLYVNSWKKVVYVKGGVIATPITFDIQDLTMIGSRNKLIVEIQNVRDSAVRYLPYQQHLPKPERVVDQEATLAEPQLIDNESGLVTNSFVGPFIPLYENQGSSLIESSKLKMQTIVSEGKNYHYQLLEQLKSESNLSEFDTQYRLSPLDLDSTSQMQWITQSMKSNVATQLVDDLNQLLDSNQTEKMTEQRVSASLCQFWVDQLLPEMLQRFEQEDAHFQRETSPIYAENYQFYAEAFVKWCQRTAKNNNPLFSFDKKFVVHSIDSKKIRYNGGSSFNLNVGSNFRLDKGESWGVRRSHSSDLSFSASAGLESPILGARMSRGESYSSSEDNSYSMGRGAGLSYGAGAYLVVQHSLFRIGIDDYDKCLIVKPRFEMMKKMMQLPLIDVFPKLKRAKFWSWLPFLASERDKALFELEIVKDLIPDGRHLDLIDSGLRVCRDSDSNPPVEVLENYFYITQHFTSGDMHDPTDLRNRLWLLQIRSARDFKVFLESILNHNKLSDVANITNTPIHILSNAYRRFQEHLPAWPGLYTQLDFNPHLGEHCSPQQDFGDNLINNFKQIVAGPLKFKDGFGSTDFWSIFYCPQQRQNF